MDYTSAVLCCLLPVPRAFSPSLYEHEFCCNGATEIGQREERGREADATPKMAFPSDIRLIWTHSTETDLFALKQMNVLYNEHSLNFMDRIRYCGTAFMPQREQIKSRNTVCIFAITTSERLGLMFLGIGGRLSQYTISTLVSGSLLATIVKQIYQIKRDEKN